MTSSVEFTHISLDSFAEITVRIEGNYKPRSVDCVFLSFDWEKAYFFDSSGIG